MGNLRTGWVLIAVRNLGRRIGVNRLLAASGNRAGYERGFQDALLVGLNPGDVVWDIGANVGFYSRLFAGLIGETGRCYAFEPSPLNRARFQELGIPDNVLLFPYALGDKHGVAQLVQGGDPLGATSFLLGRGIACAEEPIPVECMTGDLLVEGGRTPVPKCIKIDVEGYEWEVLQGCQKMLGHEGLFRIGCEIHFGILAKRGHPQRPCEIESLLKKNGFRCRWIDHSHLVAERVRCAS